jgi:hypothetical protein
MNISQALKLSANLTETENGMTAYKSTLSANLDLFVTFPMLKSVEDIEKNIHLVTNAINEDANIALRVLQWVRDIRGNSAGNREVYKHTLRYLQFSHPEFAFKLALKSIYEIGRVDDVLWLRDSKNKYEHVFTNKELRSRIYGKLWFILNSDNGQRFFVAKWLPNENGAKGFVRHEFAKHLGLSLPYIRKFIKPIRDVGLIVERMIAAQQWDLIAQNFSKLPALAFKQNLPAFKKHCETELAHFFESVNNSTAKMNVGTLTPIDIVSKVLNSRDELNNEYARSAWKEFLAKFSVNQKNVLPIIDTSGSMESWSDSGGDNPRNSPLDIAIAMGLYFAHANKCNLKNIAMTFSSKPQLFNLTGDIVADARTIKHKSIVEDTNIEAALRMLLDILIKYDIPNDELPVIMILSDMQFNTSSRSAYSTSLLKQLDAQHASIQKMFKSHGYDVPTIVYWHLGGYTKTYPAIKNERNAILLSGYNPQAFTDVLQAITENEIAELTPERAMLKTVNIPRYDL